MEELLWEKLAIKFKKKWKSKKKSECKFLFLLLISKKCLSSLSILRDAKQPAGGFKNVKARVDSGLGSKITTRADSRKALQTVSGNVKANVVASSGSVKSQMMAVPRSVSAQQKQEQPSKHR